MYKTNPCLLFAESMFQTHPFTIKFVSLKEAMILQENIEM